MCVLEFEILICLFEKIGISSAKTSFENNTEMGCVVSVHEGERAVCLMDVIIVLFK